MSKKGVSMISGSISPIVGESITYNIIDWYPETPLTDRNPLKVTWELFRKRENGKFTTTHIKKKGVNNFTFGETSWGNTYRLEAYLHEPEGGGLIIKPKPSKIPKINKVDLLYVDDSKGSTFSYIEKLRAKAHCVNLNGKELLFTVWEDDAKNSGHNSTNKAIETKKVKVDRYGVATAEFMLTRAFMEKAMRGEVDSKQLEFYVTVEYYKGKIHDSENVEIKNPRATPPSIGTKLPEKKRAIKAKGSPAEQKPASKKEEKRIWDNFKDYLHDWAEAKGTVTKEKEPTQAKNESVSTSGVGKRAPQEKNKSEVKEKLIIFPLLVKPENNSENKWGKTRNWTAKQRANMTTFNSDRDKGRRKHAGRDLYTNPLETVVAIADGIILDVKPFYCETHQVTIRHTLKDGRDFIIRYGELDPKSITVKVGDEVKQKKEIGKTGKLLKYISKTKEYIPLMQIGNDTVFMLHFEHYTGALGFNIKSIPLSNSINPYMRRADLIDSINILQEGYNNSFGNKAEVNNDIETGFSEHHARKALLYIYNKYGRDIAVIVEKMYRLETAHFTSEQYKTCGTGGMEVHGKPPYYGWDATTFKNHPEYSAIGIWSSYEGKGLSVKGGNKQQTDKPKEFVKLPSVLAGMEYKAEYIERYNGNYARWYSATDLSAQEKYRATLKGIKSKIVDSFKNEK